MEMNGDAHTSDARLKGNKMTDLEEMGDRTYAEYMTDVLNSAPSREVITKVYDANARRIHDIVTADARMAHTSTRIAAEKYCPGSRDSVVVLDVGCGTGHIGAELKSVGFKHIDGIDPSSESIEVCREKGVYRNLICEYLTKEPLDIPQNSYDMIVTCGTFVKEHLPMESLCEMIRLVKPGGNICIVSRKSSFDGKTVPAYKDIVPFMKSLEENGKIRQTIWESPVPYIEGEDGVVIVLTVL